MTSIQGRLALSAFVLVLFCPQEAWGRNLCARVRCAAPGPCRTFNGCNAMTGKCVYSKKPNGRSCSDGNPCTTRDTCQAGACVPGPVKTCPASSNICARNACSARTGKCVPVPLNNGGSCDDGKNCTTNDKCRAGRCIGTPTVCPSQGPCKTNTCIEATGECAVTIDANGTACAAADKCSLNNTCTDGVCGGGVPKVCKGSQCISKVCNSATGLCDPTFLPVATACNDGRNCTVNDTCNGNGGCRGTPVVCLSPAATQCTRTKCNELTGTCSVVNLKNGTECNDGNNCTVGDVCTNGVCRGTPKVCRQGPCVSRTCNAATGACDPTFAADSTPCSDGKNCTVNDTCLAGVCKGTAVVCPASTQQCRSLVCNERSGGLCDKLVPKPDRSACDDGNPCTTDRCIDGACRGTSKCPTSRNPCVYFECNAAGGSCTSMFQPDNTTCSDGNRRTKGDKCISGVCKGV